MTETRTRLTADEFLRLPNNAMRHELVAGELIEMVPPGGEHGYVGGRALFRLGLFVEQSGVGGAVFAAETGFRIARDPDTVRAPDAAYVSQGRLGQARVAGYPEMAPDLVVEVVSPGDTASEVQEKVQEWLRAGSQLVIVLYPQQRSAVVYRAGGIAQVLSPGDTLTGDPVLPGFSCPLADFF